jgi:predicted DsbA family dithiol-disulfide isomerase
MHKTSIHVSLKEIRGETHLNPQKHTKNKGTKNKNEKDHEIHNAKSSIQTMKDSQGLACHPSIHPSQQISHEALKLA